MVEITLSIVLQFLQTAGLLVGIIYYITIMRNTQRTRELSLKAQEHAIESRQIDIYMRWQQPLTDSDFMREFMDLLHMEWDDFDDFQRKYDHSVNAENASKRAAQWRYYGGLGYLLSRGVIDPDTIYEMSGNSSILLWGHFESVIKSFRERDSRPENWRWFEYLADEMKRVRDEKGLGTYVPPLSVKTSS
jgi:hypothetical protein